jgi:tetratricopeptide (TPR) repeat protein
MCAFIRKRTTTSIVGALAITLALAVPTLGLSQNGDKTSRAEVFQWLRQARAALLANDAPQGRKLLGDARAWTSKNPDKLATAWVEQLAGEIEFSADKTKSVAAFTAALGAFTDLKNVPGMANCHLNLGRLASVQDQHDIALKHQKQALELYGKLNRPGDTAAVLRDLGATHMALKQPTEAVAAYQKALDIYRAEASRQPAGELQVLADLALCHETAKKLDLAQETYAAAATLAGKLKEPIEEARLRGALGMLCHRQGKLEEARKEYESALRIQTGNSSEQAAEARNRNNLGALLQDQGESAAALQEYAKALKLLAALKDAAGQARSYYNMALVHESLGQDAEALSAYDKALDLRRTLKDYPGMVRILDNQALLFTAQGMAGKAKECKDLADKLRNAK